MCRPTSLLAAVLLLAACGEPVATSSSESASTAESTTTTWTIPAPVATGGGGGLVAEVVDGDTIEVEMDGGRERVRLIGINAPERGECLADEATRSMEDRIAGQQVELVADRTDRDDYGRLLRYVEVDGTDVGADLVRAGLALARRYPPDTARADEYERAQAAAEEAGAGMWATGSCGASATDVVISDIRFDAEGDDGQNPNDEWVRITNDGGSAVDLTGWVLKDTSATHRYRFPDRFLLDPGASVTVRTGCGTDTASELHWCNQGSAVWNNSGDTAFLLHPAGGIVSSKAG